MKKEYNWHHRNEQTNEQNSNEVESDWIASQVNSTEYLEKS